jgi:hypothetical protein
LQFAQRDKNNFLAVVKLLQGYRFSSHESGAIKKNSKTGTAISNRNPNSQPDWRAELSFILR